jgi:integrase
VVFIPKCRRKVLYGALRNHLLETAYKGTLRPWGKTGKSPGVIHLPKALADSLSEWKKQCPDDSPDAFIFPDAMGGFMDTGNYRRRVLHRLADDLNLPKLTFQVIRRSIATLAQRKGTVKDVRGLLRHSRTATTTDVYMQELPEGVAATVNAISHELRKKPKKAPKRVKVVGNLLPIATKSKTTGEGGVCN